MTRLTRIYHRVHCRLGDGTTPDQKRTSVLLDQGQWVYLAQRASEEHISVSSLVRRAIDLLMRIEGRLVEPAERRDGA